MTSSRQKEHRALEKKPQTPALRFGPKEPEKRNLRTRGVRKECPRERERGGKSRECGFMKRVGDSVT